MHRANSVRHSEAPRTTPMPPTSAASGRTQTDAETPKQRRTLNRGEPVTCPAASADRSQQQQQPQPGSKRPSQTSEQTAMKSCLSEGDFAGILIKLNDDQDLSGGHSSSSARPPDASSGCDQQAPSGRTTRRALSPSGQAENGDGSGSESGSLRKSRRRSSCSDAEDSKRFDSMTFSHE